MRLLGITGGIGMGKSTAAHILREAGVPVVDTDLLAREEAAPGSAGLAEVVQAFGPEILNPDGTLNREQLGRIVFGDVGQLRVLEEILHPLIRARWNAIASSWKAEGERVGAVVVPLLFEIGAATEFSEIICLACSAFSQHQRLKERGWSESHQQHRLAAQWPIERKVTASDCVVWTDTSISMHVAQWEIILGCTIPREKLQS